MAKKFSILKGAEIQLLIDRYSDLEFKDKISGLTCVQCDKLAFNHYFTNCGHIVCSNCKKKLENGRMKCPRCQSLINRIDERRSDVMKQIYALKSKCPNTKYGCNFTTTIDQIPNHVNNCEFTKEAALPVPSKETNAVLGALDKLNEHNTRFVNIETEVANVRDYLSSLEKYKEELKMELKGLRSDLNSETRKQQNNFEELKKVIKITEANLKKVIEDQIQKMLNDLEIRLNSKITKNENRLEAALEQMDRINKRTSEQNQQVIKEVDKRLIKLQAAKKENKIRDWLNEKSNINQLLDDFLFGSSKEESYFESLCYKWTVKLEKKDYEFKSDIFPISGYDLKARLCLTYNSEADVYLEMCFNDSEKEKQTVDLKCLPIVTYIFKSINRKEQHIIRCHSCLFNTTLKYNEYYYGKYIGSIFKLISPTEQSFEVLVLVEPLSFINKMPTGGAITDTIYHYEQKLQMDKDKVFYGHRSPPFLTHAGGYRVRMRMCLNGKFSNDEKGLEAVETFLSGEFDSDLTKSFRHKTVIVLIHPHDATKNITVEKKFMNTDSCTLPIASADEISSGGFIFNDSLTYQVTIEPIKKEVA